MSGWIDAYWRAAGDLVLPRECLACGARLGIRERHLCLSCAADIPYTYGWLQSHNPLADRFNAVLERHRGTEPMDYAYAVALLYYKGPYRSIPRALKYHSNLAAGRFYAAQLGRFLAAAPHFSDIDLIIPVPLYRTRRWSRGYNQAEVIARAVEEALNASCQDVAGMAPGGTRPHVTCRTDLLVRARRTRSQTRMSVEEKARNVASAFRVPERFPYGLRFFAGFVRRMFFPPSGADPESPAAVLASARHILLVDDTFTTGATLYACYAALRPCTQARISITTLAAVEGSPSVPR